MHFTPTDLRNLTFRKRLFGYKRADIKDFARHIVEDYETFGEKESELTVRQHEIEEKEALLDQKDQEMVELFAKMTELMFENEQLKERERTFTNLEKVNQIAEETAKTVQEAADKLIIEAEEKKKKLLEKAESSKMNHLLDAQIELGQLLNEQERIRVDVANKRLELVQIEQKYEETVRKKEAAERETVLLKDEFVSLRSKLLQKYTEGVDAFIKENDLMKREGNEPDSEKITHLDKKRIG
ncbi:hypothetical protein IGI37_003219 [Enterococcus sp. AZ194]|uniref:DivIVA domain-containing protein n=1 Tax=Enterococcus sp. AZ194 TaxID=2774629 RepID=UPI003F265603